MKDLFDKERRAVAAGHNRQPFIAEREGLTAEARKRGPAKAERCVDGLRGCCEGATRPPTTRPRPQQGREEDGYDGLAGCRGPHEVSGRTHTWW